MKSRISIKVSLAVAGFWILGTGQVPGQLFWKKDNQSTPPVVVVDDTPLHGGLDVGGKYRYDPHFVYNPYPWHAPAMYSGFRHYHLPSPHETAEATEGLPAEDGLSPAPDEEHDPRTALITVQVPETAEVWIFGARTGQGGTLRRFVTPPLESGTNSWYEIKARWMDGQKNVEQTRRVNLFPGARPVVDFLASEEEIAPLPRKMP